MAEGNKLSKQKLNEKLKELPKPVQEHAKRCKMIAAFLLERVKTADWFLDAKLNADHMVAAVYYHDVGKVMIPKDHLYESHCQTKAKKTVYRSHVEEGVTLAEALCGISFEDFTKKNFETYVYEAITQHHEAVDGCGFPKRLAGDEISVTGKITAIADVVDNLYFVGVSEVEDAEALVARLEAMAGEVLDATLLGALLADKAAFLSFIEYMEDRNKNKRKDDDYGLQMRFSQIRNIIENEPRELLAEFVINDPYYGIVRPEVYLPVATLSTQAPKLTLLMAERLCLMLDRITERGGEPMPVTLQIDAACFTAKRFASDMVKLLEKYSIKKNLICLMVDERGLMELEEVSYPDLFGVLSNGGYRMALRSMRETTTLIGTLDTLQVDYLFIDPSYTRRVAMNANTYGVASGILEIAHNLHLSVVFLGVDSHAAERALLKMHVRYAAGDLYGEPMSERETLSLLSRGGGDEL